MKTRQDKIKEIVSFCKKHYPSILHSSKVGIAQILYVVEKLNKPVNDDWTTFTKTYDLLSDNLKLQTADNIDALYSILFETC